MVDSNKTVIYSLTANEELAKEIPNSFIPGQFVNPSNPEAHFTTTGPAIWEDTDGVLKGQWAGERLPEMGSCSFFWGGKAHNVFPAGLLNCHRPMSLPFWNGGTY